MITAANPQSMRNVEPPIMANIEPSENVVAMLPSSVVVGVVVGGSVVFWAISWSIRSASAFNRADSACAAASSKYPQDSHLKSITQPEHFGHFDGVIHFSLLQIISGL